MQLRARLNTFRQWFDRQRPSALVAQPLLTDLELQDLQQAAPAATDNPFLIERDVQQQRLGERTSSYAGSGYEFAEHRRYTAGDGMRFTDWRIMARTGKLYRKVFHEERRPQLYLIVDRRAAMRFGTRAQLKVSCAVRQAIKLLHQARQQQLLIGSVILEQQAHWLRPSQGGSELHTIIQQLNRPCPPLPLNQQEAPLPAVLNELAVRLSPGCIIYLLSDLHDLDEACTGTLYHLAQHHRLHALHILDPAELALPETGSYRLCDEQTMAALHVSRDDHTLRQQFAAAMQQQQQARQTLLQHSGADYRLCMSDEHPDGQN